MQRLRRKLNRAVWHFYGQLRDRITPTWGVIPSLAGLRTPRFASLDWRRVGAQRKTLLFLADDAVAHRFDLLGSGPVTVRYGMECHGIGGFRYDSGPAVQVDADGHWLAGRINRANLKHAKAIWSLVDAEYQPIDWQIDFKSGYRWSERTWYRNIPIGRHRGADVKVPWELSRMQHLPALAWAYGLLVDEEPERGAEYAREYRNQILDFTATNPPRYGVNWRTTMDVALRAVSWILSWDLITGKGHRFDPAFENCLVQGLYAHGRHIAANLEWDPSWRSNHYYIDILGLLFIAAWLPRTPDTDAWLAFSRQEFFTESERQFGKDGAHCESSASYHRLVGEALAYGAAALSGLDKNKLKALKEYDSTCLHGPVPLLKPDALTGLYPLDRLPESVVERLAGAAGFSIAITQNNGDAVQIGDTDSGRFAKLQPCGRLTDDGWKESHLDHRPLVGAISGLIDCERWRIFSEPYTLDAVCIEALAGQKRLRHLPAMAQLPNNRMGFSAIAVPESAQSWRLELPHGSCDDLTALAFADFGLWIIRGERLHLTVRCGATGRIDRGGHAHNDQLSVTLCVDGIPVIQDPGTYCYTPFPEQRNRYRSVLAHFAPRPTSLPHREPGDLNLGLFRLDDRAQAECLGFDNGRFLGHHRGFGYPVWRYLKIEDDVLEICDWSEGAPLLPTQALFEQSRSHAYVRFSPGYGLLAPSCKTAGPGSSCAVSRDSGIGHV